MRSDVGWLSMPAVVFKGRSDRLVTLAGPVHKNPLARGCHIQPSQGFHKYAVDWQRVGLFALGIGGLHRHKSTDQVNVLPVKRERFREDAKAGMDSDQDDGAKWLLGRHKKPAVLVRGQESDLALRLLKLLVRRAGFSPSNLFRSIKRL